jgi:hypothetical protein
MEQRETYVRSVEEVLELVMGIKKAVVKANKGVGELHDMLTALANTELEPSLATASITEEKLGDVLDGFEWFGELPLVLTNTEDLVEIKRVAELIGKHVTVPPVPVEVPTEPIDIINPAITIELPEEPLQGQDVSDNGEQPQHGEHHE